MLKIYCSDCGSPTTYTANKPKFCSNCGNLFEKNVNAQKPIIKDTPKKELPKISRSANIEDYDDDFYDEREVNHVPNINGLDCDIVETSYKGEKIGNLFGTSEGSVRSENNPKSKKKLSKEDRKRFLEEFAKEAGAIKPKTRIRKNAS